MQLDYYGFWIEKNYYKYNKKYRVVEINPEANAESYKYCLQKKSLFRWRTIMKFEWKNEAADIYNMIKQRRNYKIKEIIIGD